MKFSFMSWNVRNFKGNPSRLDQADELITSLNPDLFGLIEFRAKDEMRELMISRFPEYDFAVTDSTRGLEIVAAWRRGKFRQAIWTQKREFAANSSLRPGGLLSVNLDGEFYNLLFLHTDSGTEKSDYENRAEMFKKIWKMRRALEKASSSKTANLIVLGDLNTMGRDGGVTGAQEIAMLRAAAAKKKMKLLDKDQPYTWHQWKRRVKNKPKKLRISDLKDAMKSDLDHVVSSKTIDIRGRFPIADKVHVLGWNQLGGKARIDFLWDLTDHSAVYGRVM